MYRFRNLQRQFTTAITTETIPEHFNKNAKFYGVILTSVTLFGGVIWGRISESERRLEKDINELKEDMKEMKKELRYDIKEIKDMLTPLVVEVKLGTKRIDNLEKS